MRWEILHLGADSLLTITTSLHDSGLRDPMVRTRAANNGYAFRIAVQITVLQVTIAAIVVYAH